MKKAKYSEVPVEYRKDYKKKCVESLGLIASALLFDFLLVLLVILNNN